MNSNESNQGATRKPGSGWTGNLFVLAAIPAIAYTLISVAGAFALQVKTGVPFSLWALLTSFDELAGAIAALAAVIGLILKLMSMILDMQRQTRELIEEQGKHLGKRIDKQGKRIDEQGKRIDEQGKRIDALLAEFNKLSGMFNDLVLHLLGAGKVKPFELRSESGDAAAKPDDGKGASISAKATGSIRRGAGASTGEKASGS